MDSEMSFVVQPAAPTEAAASRSSAAFMHLPPLLIVSPWFSSEQDFVDPRASQRKKSSPAGLVDDDEADLVTDPLLVDGDAGQRLGRQPPVEIDRQADGGEE